MRTHRQIQDDLADRVAAAKAGKMVHVSKRFFKGTDEKTGLVKLFALPGETFRYANGRAVKKLQTLRDRRRRQGRTKQADALQEQMNRLVAS